MTWTIRVPLEMEDWILSLPPELQELVVAAMEVLEEFGPAIKLWPVDAAAAPTSLRLPTGGGSIVIAYEWNDSTITFTRADVVVAVLPDSKQPSTTSAVYLAATERGNDPRLQ